MDNLSGGMADAHERNIHSTRYRIHRSLSIMEGEERAIPQLTIHHAFQDIVKASRPSGPIANCVAVRMNGKSITFVELNRKANSLARAIKSRLLDEKKIDFSGMRQHVIALFVSESDIAVQSILAVLKLGAAYTVMDKILPQDRIKFIINEVQVSAVVATDDGIAYLKDAGLEDTLILSMSELLSMAEKEKLCEENIADIDVLPGFNEKTAMCSIIYTSGSTGTPKGVKIRHASSLNNINYMSDVVKLKEGDVASAMTSLMFIPHISEIFFPLLQGVPIVVFPKSIKKDPDQLIKALDEEKVSVIPFIAPYSLDVIVQLNQILDEPKLQRLRYVNIGGEPVPSQLVYDFYDYFDEGTVFVDGWGLSETSNDVICMEFHGKRDLEQGVFDEGVSIGVPIHNTIAYILGTDGNPVQHGETGELCISGVCVSPGYMDAEKAFSFIPNTLSNQPGHEVLFKTGDFAKIKNDKIVYCGRRDQMVKIRGYRVNISEIEAAMHKLQVIEKVAIVQAQRSEADVYLTGFYTCRPGQDVSVGQVKKACEAKLPSYMIPERFNKLNEMPLKEANAKIDRTALKKLLEQVN